MTPNPSELTIDNSVLMLIDHQPWMELASFLSAPVPAGSR